jgi:hypothetical protein
VWLMENDLVQVDGGRCGQWRRAWLRWMEVGVAYGVESDSGGWRYVWLMEKGLAQVEGGRCG